MSSPVKRKRAAPVALVDGNSDVESADVVSVRSTNKKARYQDVDENASDHSLSPTNNESHIGTTTVADASTPLTNDSSVRRKGQPRPKNFHCTFPDCNKSFTRPIHLQSHINYHTGERPHVCPESECGQPFHKPEHLHRHMQSKHSDKSYVCTYQVRNEYTDEIGPCGKVFPTTHKLKRHVALHESKEETTCTWEGCAKVFRKQETLQRHIKKDHLDEDAYICTRETADGEACGQSFATPGQLKGHLAREHDAPKYVCETCTNGILPLPNLLQPNDLDPEFLPTLEDLAGSGNSFDPDLMGGLSLQDVAPTELQYPAGVIAFATFHDLQRHNKFVHPPICQECGKKCKSNKDLTAHMDIMHPTSGAPAFEPPKLEKKFLCPYDGCIRSVPNNGFTKKGNMDVHIKSTHTRQKDYVCGQYDMGANKRVDGWNGQGCGAALTSKQSLIGHIRTQHLGLPAALGARTGLQDKDRTRWVPPSQLKQTEPQPKEEDEAMADVGQATEVPNVALSMLTGAGYEQLRPHACFQAAGPQGCQMRFAREIDLCTHMEMTHGWTIDDINETLASGR